MSSKKGPVDGASQQAKIRKGGRFVKGQSGNPGGRVALPPEYKDALKDLSIRALGVLEEIMENGRHPDRAKVSMYLVDRQWGRPKTGIEVSGPGGGPVRLSAERMTTDEMRRRLAELQAIAVKQRLGMSIEDAKEEDSDGHADAEYADDAPAS